MRNIKNLKPQYYLIIALMFLSSGCLVRTYTVAKERPDQDISGNQGYLLGGPTQKKEREIKTRETYVVEVEFGTPRKAKDKSSFKKKDISQKDETYQVPASDKITAPTKTEIESKDQIEKVDTYVVKKGDTLEKIAARPEIYGDKKKWYRIFKANKDKLKEPDKIIPGQVLRIPR